MVKALNKAQPYFNHHKHAAQKPAEGQLGLIIYPVNKINGNFSRW